MANVHVVTIGDYIVGNLCILTKLFHTLQVKLKRKNIYIFVASGRQLVKCIMLNTNYCKWYKLELHYMSIILLSII